MKGEMNANIPKFQSLEEEREYWESRGPLAKGHKGRLSKPELGQKRSSFLSVRLTGEELTQLRDMAVELGMGPSTYARHVLRLAIEQKNLGMLAPLFRLHSLVLQPPFRTTGQRGTIVEVEGPKKGEKPLEEILNRAEKAYAAYLEALRLCEGMKKESMGEKPYKESEKAHALLE